MHHCKSRQFGNFDTDGELPPCRGKVRHRTGSGNGRAQPPSAQRPDPTGDSAPDLVRRIFLNVVAPRDRHLG